MSSEDVPANEEFNAKKRRKDREAQEAFDNDEARIERERIANIQGIRQEAISKLISNPGRRQTVLTKKRRTIGG